MPTPFVMARPPKARSRTWQQLRKLASCNGTNGFGAVKTPHPTTESLGSRCAFGNLCEHLANSRGRWLEMTPRTAASSLSVRSSLCALASGESRRNRPTPSRQVPTSPSRKPRELQASRRLRGSGAHHPTASFRAGLLHVRRGSASQGRLVVRALAQRLSSWLHRGLGAATAVCGRRARRLPIGPHFCPGALLTPSMAPRFPPFFRGRASTSSAFIRCNVPQNGVPVKTPERTLLDLSNVDDGVESERLSSA